ncbi:MAG: type VI secretion system contractile sheath large subunit, partial [Bilophila sp.]
VLQKMSEVAAAAHTPMLSAASPQLFGLESFTSLSLPRDLHKIFQSTDYSEWRSFREREDARYVTLCLPHMLLRLPYGLDTNPVETFAYEEDVSGPSPECYLWGNAAFALAGCITAAFAKYGWTAAIRGYEGGGAVEGLNVYKYRQCNGETVALCPTEISLTDRREKELSDLGFIALVYRKNSDKAAFFSGQTVHKPQTYSTDSANANANISARLPYLLNASRFAHYVKANMRDKVGSFMTAESVSTYLNAWISQYVLLSDDAGDDIKARYPLREARVDVAEVLGNPGAYKCVIFLRPHFQLEELTASIRLVAELPPPAA